MNNFNYTRGGGVFWLFLLIFRNSSISGSSCCRFFKYFLHRSLQPSLETRTHSKCRKHLIYFYLLFGSFHKFKDPPDFLILHFLNGLLDNPSALVCFSPLRCWISKSNVSITDIHLASMPSAPLKFFNHTRNAWSVRKRKCLPKRKCLNCFNISTTAINSLWVTQ